jgi:hypothetical protein
MGRLEVREAVAAYFAEAELPFVGKVFPARPTIMEEDAYQTSMLGEAVMSANGSSAVLVVNITDDTRQRRALAGRGAVNDSWLHKMHMEVFFGSTGGEAEIAQKDYDTIVDGMVNLIRANATLNSTQIWSAGEYDIGIEHKQGAPFTGADGLTICIIGDVLFDAYEWIAGPV